MISPATTSWPSLRVSDWTPTRDTLHMWTQIVGKIRMAHAPLLNHWWQVTLYVSSRGLTTSAIPYRTGCFEIEFDFVGHQQVKNVSSPVTSYRVTLGGTNSRPGRAPPGPAQSPPHPAPAAADVARSRPEFLPRPIAVALALSVFLFAINAFTGFREVWFQWPTAGLLLVAVLRVLLRRR